MMSVNWSWMNRIPLLLARWIWSIASWRVDSTGRVSTTNGASCFDGDGRRIPRRSGDRRWRGGPRLMVAELGGSPRVATGVCLGPGGPRAASQRSLPRSSIVCFGFDSLCWPHESNARGQREHDATSVPMVVGERATPSVLCSLHRFEDSDGHRQREPQVGIGKVPAASLLETSKAVGDRVPMDTERCCGLGRAAVVEDSAQRREAIAPEGGATPEHLL